MKENDISNQIKYKCNIDFCVFICSEFAGFEKEKKNKFPLSWCFFFCSFSPHNNSDYKRSSLFQRASSYKLIVFQCIYKLKLLRCVCVCEFFPLSSHCKMVKNHLQTFQSQFAILAESNYIHLLFVRLIFLFAKCWKSATTNLILCHCENVNRNRKKRKAIRQSRK